MCISLLIRTATVAAHPAEGSSVAFVSTRPIRSGVKRIRHKGERHAHPLQAQSSSAHLAGSAGAESKQQQGPDVRVCGECMGCSASWLPDRLANAELPLFCTAPFPWNRPRLLPICDPGFSGCRCSGSSSSHPLLLGTKLEQLLQVVLICFALGTVSYPYAISQPTLLWRPLEPHRPEWRILRSASARWPTVPIGTHGLANSLLSIIEVSNAVMQKCGLPL